MKIMSFCLLLGFLTIQMNCYSQDNKFGRVKIDILQAVIKIEIPTKGGPLTGTGFIVSRQNAVIKENRDYFLVTNKHMVGDWNLADKNISNYYNELTLYFYSKSGQNGDLFKPMTFKILDAQGRLTNKIKIHPNPVVDIAIINITEFIADPMLEINSFDTSYLQGFAQMNGDLELGVGDQVFAVGYPFGITSLKTNYPIAKSCYISSVIQNDFEVKTKVQNRSQVAIDAVISGEFYLVDGLIVGGNSGSPIVIPAGAYFKIQNKQTAQRELPNLIIGIQSSSMVGSGINVVYGADYIKELVGSF